MLCHFENHEVWFLISGIVDVSGAGYSSVERDL